MTVKEACLVLGLTEDATLEDVKRAYKEESNAWHPDRFTAGTKMHDRAQEKLKRLNEARTVLEEHLSRRASAPDASASSAGPHGMDSAVIFQADVTYLGGDPRLDTSPIPFLNRIPAAIVITSDGILLLFDGSTGAKEWIAYPKERFVDIVHHGRHYSANDVVYDANAYQAFEHVTNSNDVLLRTTDPEGILASINVKLRFNNEYIASVFANRLIEHYFPVDVKAWVLRRKADIERQQRERLRLQAEEYRRRVAALWQRLKQFRQHRKQQRRQKQAEKQQHREAKAKQKQQEQERKLAAQPAVGRRIADSPIVRLIFIAVLAVYILQGGFSAYHRYINSPIERTTIPLPTQTSHSVHQRVQPAASVTNTDRSMRGTPFGPGATSGNANQLNLSTTDGIGGVSAAAGRRVQAQVDRLSDAEIDELAARFTRLTSEQMSLLSPEYLLFIERVLERKISRQNQR